MNYKIFMMITEARKTKLRFEKHANDKIAAKFIVCPGDDSVVGTPGWNVLCLCRKLTRKMVFHFSVKFLIRLSQAIYLEVFDYSLENCRSNHCRCCHCYRHSRVSFDITVLIIIVIIVAL